MAASVNQTKIVIPTGFESQQRRLERRQALAQALLEKGLAGPGNNATSWLQPIASIAQAWAGRRMADKVDRQQDELSGEIKQRYNEDLSGFYTDAAGMTPEQLVQKYQGNPLLQEALEPYKAAHQSSLVGATRKKPIQTLWDNPETGRREMRTMMIDDTGNAEASPIALPNTHMRDVNGVAVDLSAATPGQILPQDPNAYVVLGPNGQPVINEPRVAAGAQVASAAAGYGYTPSGGEPLRGPAERRVVRTGRRANGQRVILYSDGSIEDAN